MDVVVALERLGGVGTTAQLRALCGRTRLARAVAAGRVLRLGRGRFVLSDAQRDRRRAVELAGVTSHLSAAQHHGWPVKTVPDQPWVTVRRKRHLDSDTRATVHVAYADLTTDEALAVADSALRAGGVTTSELGSAATRARGPGATACRRIAAEADGRAANPFESVLRAIVLDSGGFDAVPQHAVEARGRTWHPDLVDVRRRLVVEADSWEFHTGRDEHSRDCVRYTALSVCGWTVLRFTWEQVMLSPSYVGDVLREVKKMPAAA